MSSSDIEAEAAPPATGPRQARLYLSRLDPWTVMKTAFVVSLGLAIVVIVATMLLWTLLSLTGTFDSINQTLNDVGGSGSSSLDVSSFLSFGRIMGFALLLAAFEIVLTSALATVIAAIYNITVDFTGGVEVTLSEDH
ncbi:MAG: DUF3566 domain-containing protein [Candidatus Nanopelagicales bacterium]